MKIVEEYYLKPTGDGWYVSALTVEVNGQLFGAQVVTSQYEVTNGTRVAEIVKSRLRHEVLRIIGEALFKD